ncbi:MAG: PEP-CTERM sorting domain-containing protein [Verrucomicrobiaceae bacterium]|nr:MAG: PEP-CTERM sorting domain-containing protein [Verrucomicrobiaceae bacterium]
MKIHSSLTLVAPVLLALSPTLPAALTIPMNPVADAFVTSANTSGNYGSAGAIAVSAPGMAKGELQTLMMFNFSSAKTAFDAEFGAGQWSVSSISLQLAAANPGNPIFNSSAAGTISVRWFDDDTWVEGTGTPASVGASGVNFGSLAALFGSGTQSAGSLAFGGGTSGANVITLSSAGLLADILAGSTGSLNFLAGDSSVSGVFNSRNFNSSANWPVLSVTAIPEPSAGLLALGGVMAAGLRRRRR